MKLGEKICAQRKKLGLSQEELAVRLNVTRQAVSKWETGTSVPELETLVALARVFGVTTDYLLSVEEAPEPAEPLRQDRADFLERLPGFLGGLFRRYGWLGGLYLSLSGAGFLAMGLLIRYMVSRMFGNIGIFGTAAADPFFADFIRQSPVYIMGGFIMGLGGVMILAGVILAVWLKKRGK